MKKTEKKTRYYLKKATVSALGAVTAASLLVSGLFPSLHEITAGIPETPPAIVQIYEPEQAEEKEETAPRKRKTLKERLKEKLLTLPVWARSAFLLPLWGTGTALLWLLRKVLPGFLRWLLGAMLPLLLLLAGLKLLFPDVPLRKLLCKKNRIALLVLAVLLFVSEPVLGHFFPGKDWIVFCTKAALLGLTFLTACLQIQFQRRAKEAVPAAR